VLSNILIKPVSVPGELPIRLGHKVTNGNVMWDEETTIKVDEDTQFHFFDFFDWYQYGQVDLPFVRARMLPQSEDNLGEGQRALIEQRHCKFILVASA
jgi:hypothetical protein